MTDYPTKNRSRKVEGTETIGAKRRTMRTVVVVYTHLSFLYNQELAGCSSRMAVTPV